VISGSKLTVKDGLMLVAVLSTTTVSIMVNIADARIT